eukprot:3456429-Pyramimonas_sp.AAC.1
MGDTMHDVTISNACVYQLEGDYKVQAAEGTLRLRVLASQLPADASYPQVPGVVTDVEVLRVEIGDGAFSCILTSNSRVTHVNRLEYICMVVRCARLLEVFSCLPDTIVFLRFVEKSPGLTIAIKLAEDTAESTIQQVLHLFWNVYQAPNQEGATKSGWISKSDYVADSLTYAAKSFGQGELTRSSRYVNHVSAST